jgi:hypothetical protein
MSRQPPVKKRRLERRAGTSRMSTGEKLMVARAVADLLGYLGNNGNKSSSRIPRSSQRFDR